MATVIPNVGLDPNGIATASYQELVCLNYSIANNTNRSELVDLPPLVEMVPVCIAMVLLIIVTIVGNILVIMSVFTYRPLKGVQNFFIVSLALADMAVAILVMPFHVINFIFGRWVLGSSLCEMWLTSDIYCCTASILNICMIALDRYWAIHDPLNYAHKRTFKRVLVWIMAVWAVSGVISVPPVFGWNDKGDSLYDAVNQVCHLTNEKSYVIYSAFGSFYGPLLIMTFVYLKIFLAMRKRLRKRSKSSGMATLAAMPTAKKSTTLLLDKTPAKPSVEDPHDSSDSTNEHESANGRCSHVETTNKMLSSNPKCTSLKTAGRSRSFLMQNVTKFVEEKQKISLSKERKAARTLGVIMGVFILCWLPFFLLYIILPFCDSCTIPDTKVEYFVVWLGYVNSGLNPFIYTCFNSDFRKAFEKLLCSKMTRRPQRV